MRDFLGHRASWASLVLAAVVLVGCGGQAGSDDTDDQLDELELGPKIGLVAAVVRPEPTPVEGFGLVGGLPGTGSSICPVQLRTYLRQYILTQLPSGSLNIDEFIDSPNTAVVWLEGAIPAIPSKGQKFDVQVRPVAGSDPISLHGGWLYQVELRRQGTGGLQTRALATVEGPVFVNTLETDDVRMTEGCVLGGGAALSDYTGVLHMRHTNYRAASTTRNRLNERFGVGTATSVSADDVAFMIPPAYRRRPERFVLVLAAMYLTETPELLQRRIETFTHGLTVPALAERSEVTLEAIGRRCLEKLAPLMEADDEGVRFRAARCVLSLGDDRGLGPLHAIAMDRASARRLEALAAVVQAARRNDASVLARQLLRDRDRDIVLAAYEHLREMEDVAVRQDFVGRRFYLEQVVQTDRKAIFVARRGAPRVVIFGAPLQCRDSLFVQAPQGRVVVDSRAGQDYASLTRSSPHGEGVIGPIRVGLDLSAIVRTLGGESGVRRGGSAGLGVPYADIVAVLEQLVTKEGVAAEFWAGPLAKSTE